jgi:rare lipoprotein A
MRTRVSFVAPVILVALCSSAAFAQAPATAEGTAAATAAAPAAAATPAGVETGKIAWYGKKFAGHKTASGQHYNPNAMTMAHKSLPFGTKVKVTNPANGHSVVLRVNDRGPSQADRVGDVSYAAAKRLGMLKSGVIDAQLEVVEAKSKP